MIYNYSYVVLFGDKPILSAHTQKDIEEMLDDYNGVYKGISERVEYKPYNNKYPSINDLEGVYYYKDLKTGEIDEFKVYGVEYKREKNEN